jgi:hypothetical protein
MEPCKVCGEVARYILDDGSVVCTSHVPDPAVPSQPTGCKTFCATRSYDREHLGERVTEWVRENNVEVTQTFVAQSSDFSFHAISIVLFYRGR